MDELTGHALKYARRETVEAWAEIIRENGAYWDKLQSEQVVRDIMRVVEERDRNGTERQVCAD